jgi:hypothetical protein
VAARSARRSYLPRRPSEWFICAGDIDPRREIIFHCEGGNCVFVVRKSIQGPTGSRNPRVRIIRSPPEPCVR